MPKKVILIRHSLRTKGPEEEVAVVVVAVEVEVAVAVAVGVAVVEYCLHS